MKYITDYNQQGTEIRFYEEDHIYETDKVKNFVSCTTFLGRFFEVFDTINISQRYADKRGYNVEDVREAWRLKSLNATILGKKMHRLCECILNGEKCDVKPIGEDELKLFKEARIRMLEILEEYDIIATEKIVFSEKLCLSGAMDVLMRRKKDSILYIGDFKTGHDITFENQWRNGLSPIRHLTDSNGYHYALQTELYKFLLKYGGDIDKKEKVRKIIIHFSLEDGVSTLRMPNMFEEMKSLIDTLK